MEWVNRFGGPCFTRELPPSLRWAAMREAGRERQDNIPQGVEVQRLVVAYQKRWEQGRRLGVALAGATSQQRRDYFSWLESGWSASCSLTFTETPWNQAEIRFTLQPGGGNFSVLGTDCLQLLPSGQPSGNIGQWMKGTVLHETGHAINLHHEMASPANPLTPNWAQLIPWAAQTQGWSADQLRAQYQKDNPQDVAFSAFDIHSVMQYFQEAWMNLQGVEVPPADDLSPGDRSYVGRSDIYGPPGASPVSPPVLVPPDVPPLPSIPPIPVPVLSLVLRRTVELPYRAGAVVPMQYQAPRPMGVVLKVMDREPSGSPIVDVLPNGGQPVRLPPFQGNNRNVVLFPVNLSSPGLYQFHVQFRGTAPSTFQVQLSRS